MYHLLAVDDEKAVLEMLEDALDWPSLGIGCVYTSTGISEAKNIIENQKIHLLLCDIEMPGGSGLELLEWIREEGYPIITMFLTGFANFDYARRAISLGSLDYLLKPVTFKDLREALKKAVLRLEMEYSVRTGLEYDTDNLPARKLLAEKNKDKFWEDILCVHHGGSRDFIAHSAQNYGITHVIDEKFLLICAAPGDMFGRESGSLPESEICREIVLDILGRQCVWCLRLKEMLAIICAPGASMGELSYRGKALIEAFGFHFGVNLSVYVGEEVRIEQLYRQFTMLKFINKENIAASKIYFLNHWKKQADNYVRPDFNAWSQLLAAGSEELLYGAVREYMEPCRQRGDFTKEVREVFFHDFLQMLYTVLKQKGIWANALFGSHEALQVFEHAMRSYEDLELNIWMLIHEAGRLMAQQEPVADDMAAVKAYVAEHIFTDFSREDIAGHIHMSPEHLSRLFKKSEGITLIDYIQMKKIEAAKELLKTTRLSVGEIALRIGYKNFAYFSGIFKKYTGLTPLNYRKQGSNGK